MKNAVSIKHFKKKYLQLAKFSDRSFKAYASSGKKINWDKINRLESYLLSLYFKIEDHDEQTVAGSNCLSASTNIRVFEGRVKGYQLAQTLDFAGSFDDWGG